MLLLLLRTSASYRVEDDETSLYAKVSDVRIDESHAPKTVQSVETRDFYPFI